MYTWYVIVNAVGDVYYIQAYSTKDCLRQYCERSNVFDALHDNATAALLRQKLSDDQGCKNYLDAVNTFNEICTEVDDSACVDKLFTICNWLCGSPNN